MGEKPAEKNLRESNDLIFSDNDIQGKKLKFSFKEDTNKVNYENPRITRSTRLLIVGKVDEFEEFAQNINLPAMNFLSYHEVEKVENSMIKNLQHKLENRLKYGQVKIINS